MQPIRYLRCMVIRPLFADATYPLFALYDDPSVVLRNFIIKHKPNI
jgi:hypothetical protein